LNCFQLGLQDGGVDSINIYHERIMGAKFARYFLAGYVQLHSQIFSLYRLAIAVYASNSIFLQYSIHFIVYIFR